MTTWLRCLLQLLCIITLCCSIGAGSQIFDSFLPPTERFAPQPEGKWAFESNARVTEHQKRPPVVLEAKDYYIRLRPYFPAPGVEMPAGRNMTFDGVTTFIFTVKKPTSTFTLYSFNLAYSKITLMDSQGLPLGIVGYELDTTLDHLIITPSQTPVVENTYLLQFTYTGLINHYLNGGLYYTHYVDIYNTMHWMIGSHMENGFQARSVFPCLDEPAYKAIFHTTLIHPKQLVALSNSMERESVDYESGWSITRFPPTPKMSTYLTAFAVGPFVSQSTVNQAGTLVRIWGWTGQEKYLAFAAEVSAKCLYSLGVYLNFTYPMSKSDQIGLPEFRAGAMENFGLIIYKYEYIAFNPDVHSTYVKQAAAKVMCHELAHQWFGDIVTASWWSELVVNEGFASYFEIYGQAMALPEQAAFLESKFLNERLEDGLTFDANLANSHPIVVVPDGRYFDKITYSKGSSMYRMTKLTLGEQVFQEALQDYIQSYQYSNADHGMLFEKFTTAAQKHNLKDWCGRPLNVSEFLEPWFLQQCFPWLTVANNQLMEGPTVTQQPYNNISSLPVTNFPYNYSWPVPLFNKDHMNIETVFRWIKPAYDVECTQQRASAISSQERSFANNRAIHWDFENARSSAFVRVQYDDIGYARLVDDLKANRDTHYTTSDMMSILGDEKAFVQEKRSANQQFSYKRLIELMRIIIPDYPHYGPFYLVQSVIDELELLFEDGLDYELFQRFMNALLLKNYESLDWSETGNWDKDVARYLMMPYVVRYNISDSLAQAQKIFAAFTSDCAQTTTGVDKCSKIHPDVRKAVYCAAIKHGSSSDFQFLLKMYRQQIVHGYYFYQEYYAMLHGMSCTQSQTDMNSLIAEMFKAYRPSSSYRPFAYLSRNPLASDMMIAYMRANINEVLNSPYLTEYLNGMSATWQTNARLDQYKKLVADLSGSMSQFQKEIFDNHIKLVQEQVDWYTSNYRDIGHIFYDHFVKKGDEPFSERLSHDLMPLTYDVFVQPYFPSSAVYEWSKNMTFDSTTNITIEVMTATDKIRISVHRLLIEPSNIILMDSKGAPMTYTKAVKDYENGIMTIYLPQTLQKGTKFSLYIRAIGFIFYGPSEGVYTNFNFFEFNGKMAWILTTDNEAGPDLRSLWPCFDEPYFKANWSVIIKHPSDMIALCNMIDEGFHIDKTEHGWATTSFNQAPLISSYLIALAVGHFASLEKISKTGVLVRVWAWTGMERYAQEGLDMAAGTLDYLAEMLNVSYSLPKLDLVALPQYTGTASALENWGIVCMIYDTVLIDPLYATASDHIKVARVTPHEVVHQWFGNLVTSEWWSLIFLNEAFAQYYYSSGANYTYPEQEKHARFVRFFLADYALTRDGDPSMTRPIITDKKPIFTYAPYYKGASILYMLNNAIGESVMEEGLRDYFQKNAWKTTTEIILWRAITAATKAHQIIGWDGKLLDVQDLMDPWTKQENYPVLKLVTSGEAVTYSQEPFITDLSALEPSIFNYSWPIPVHSQTAQNPDSFRYFLPTHTWTRPLGTSWQVENPGSVGCYRVWYDDRTWAPIREQLKTNLMVFDELTRAQFISDAYALRERGSVPWSRVLEMVEFLQRETEYAPHFAFQRVRDKLLTAFKGTADMQQIKKFVQKSIDSAYLKHGWSASTDWATASLTTLVTEAACATGDEGCLYNAATLFSKFLTNCQYSVTGTGLCNSDVAADVRRTQYCYGLKRNLQDGVTLVKTMIVWLKENSYYFHRDEDNLLNALACSGDRTLTNSLIADVLTGKYPVTLLEYISQHDDTDSLLWEYFKAHANEVVYGVPNFSDYAKATAATWNTAQQLNEIDAFLASNEGSSLSNENKQVMADVRATIQRNIDWLSKNRNEIMNWINANIH